MNDIAPSTPYIYLIGWEYEESEQNKYYIGMRHAVGCHPSDIWVKYFTSSERVRDYSKVHGVPTVIIILKTYETCYTRDQKHGVSLECKKDETSYLKSVNAKDNDFYLNASYTDGAFGVPDNITRQKMRKNRLGKIHSEETKEKIRANGKGLKRSSETCSSISKGQKGKVISNEQRLKISETLKGRQTSDETIEKIKTSISMLLWWTNGEVNKRSIAQPGPEFKQGRTLSKATKVKIRESRGGNTLSDENKKKISDSTKGLLLWNNGIKQVKSRTCPGPEWIQGRISRSYQLV